MNLTLYSDNLTLYGDILALYGGALPEPAVTQRSGGGWLPVIYVDRDGNPVDLDAKIEKAVETVREPERVADIAAVSGKMDDAKWIIANDMVKEAEVVLQYLYQIDAFMADMIRQDIARAMQEADDNEAIAVLLLMH